MFEYPTLVNPAGVYGDLFPAGEPFEYGPSEQELIQKTKESERGYLDHMDLNFFHHGKKVNSISAFSINLFQPNLLLQFELEWEVHFDLVDNFMIKLFHMLEQVQQDFNIVNEESLTQFFKMNTIKIKKVSKFTLPTNYTKEDINSVTNYGNSFVYHFIPGIGLSYDVVTNDEPSRTINKDFSDFNDCTKLLMYHKFYGEDIFTPREPISFQFERKRFRK